MKPLLVLIGAGASYSSGEYARVDRPPLTRDLFTAERSRALLKTYTLAMAAGTAIERDKREDTTLEFEAALRRLRSDGYPHHEQMASAVPPFLQALLLDYSQQLRADCYRYTVLVDELLKIGTHVLFVSLNYDCLLDWQLAAYAPLETISDYVEHTRGWNLLKPHGSVAWYIDQPSSFDPRAPARDLQIVRAPITCVPLSRLTLVEARASHPDEPHSYASRYPAIALPDGPKDELVWPPEHRQHLHAVLNACQEIQLLILGYSALDTEILELLKAAPCKVRRMTIVNAGAQSALDVFTRVKGFGIDAIWEDVVPEPLADWIDGDGLRRWAREYNGRFDSLTSPEAVTERLAADRERSRAAQAHGDNIMTRPF